jgi:ribosomal protein L40E
MEFKGCQRCGGDLRVEEDMTSRLEELVCLQCGNRQGTLASFAGRTTHYIDDRLRLTPRSRSKYAA